MDRIDPVEPNAARVEVAIDASSIRSGESTLDNQMRTADWLSVRAHPQIRYAADGLLASGPNRGIAVGTVEIRGFAKPVGLSFDLIVNGRTAHARGSGEVMQLDFGIGQNVGDGLASLQVIIEFDSLATRPEPHRPPLPPIKPAAPR